MKAHGITIAALAALAVATSATASPLPVEGGDADWAQPRVLSTGSAASHYTDAAVAAMGARGQAAAAFYAPKRKATAKATRGTVETVRVRPYGAADTPGNSEAALSDLNGFGDTVAEPATTQLTADEADAARSVAPDGNGEPVIDAFDGYYDMWPTGTDRTPVAQPGSQPATRLDDLDAALAAYDDGAVEPWLRHVLGLPDVDTSVARTTCFAVAFEPTPSSQAADPQSEAYAAAKEAYDSGASDPMLRDILGIAGFGRQVLLVHTGNSCSDSTSSSATERSYSPGVADEDLALLYGAVITA